MSLASGTKLAHYEIVGPLGEGGMGEVYRAHDSRLRRDVAIKVLPASFASDEDRLRRFEQEALATAALNHPNILVVYDVGKDAGTAYVALELLEGQTLRDLAASQTLPVRKVLDIAGQTAAGLAAAHDKGIVHRDLKPENLFVTTDGRLKILDFGLAKQIDRAADASNVSRTVLAGTEPGMVLGTMGYMAPEQVRGGTIDHRADIFSFGAILYELLSGHRAFSGATPADTMTAILKESPADLTASRATVPPALARVVDRCLEKHPSARFQSASDLAFALQTLGTATGSGSTIAPAAAKPRLGLRIWMAGTAVVSIAVLAFAAWRGFGGQPPVEAAPMAMLEVAAPAGHDLGERVELSPDGRYLAFTVARAGLERERQLWLRDLSSGAQRPLKGTDGATSQFWAPDSSEIGFFSQGRLRAIEPANEKIRVICDAGGGRTSGAWSQSGVIVFSTDSGVPLQRVDADGKTPAATLGTVEGFRPFFLPDGRHFLYSGRGMVAAGIHIADVETGEKSLLRSTGREPKYADGQLLFVQEGQIVTMPFDPVARVASGEPRALAAIDRHVGDVGVNFSVAGGRLLAFRNVPAQTRQLIWRGRDGSRQGIVDGAGDWANPELSPNEKMLVAQRDERQGTGADVWLVDVARGTSRALAVDRGPELAPFWSTDGSRIMYLYRGGTNRASLMAAPLDGPPAPIAKFEGIQNFIHGISSDSRLLLGFGITPEGHRDISVFPAGDPSKAYKFAAGAANETQPALSPDGAWLAYTSDELGLNNTRDVFIQAFPGGGQKVHVTVGTSGGLQPRWSRDGKQLYYLGADRRITVVSIEHVGNTLRVGPPSALFEVAVGLDGGIGTRAAYDVSRDGQRFIVAENRGGQEELAVPITVLVDWKSKAAAGK